MSGSVVLHREHDPAPYRCRMFGLDVHSELYLPPGEESSGEPQVFVRVGSLEHTPRDPAKRNPLVHAEPGLARFFWPEVGTVEVRGGREIVVDPLPDTGPELLSHIIQGVAMGTLLDQRGLFTLHASAVAIDGRVAAFIGWKGHGKSTLCATLYGRGHAFVTDDILALDGCGVGPVEVLPGTEQVKLYPDSLAASLGEDPETLPRIWGPSPKRLRAIQNATRVARPLGVIYVLDFRRDGGSDFAIEPLPQQVACLELIRHSYALRFLEEGGASPRHLARCAWLAGNVPVRRLVRPAQIERILESAEAIEADMRSLGAPAPGGPALVGARPRPAVPSAGSGHDE